MKPTGYIFTREIAKQFSIVHTLQKLQLAWMVQRHYLRKFPAVMTCAFILHNNDVPVGCIIYSLPPKQTYVRYGGLTWELARLWIQDEMPTNTESWFIAQTTKALQKMRPEVKYLVSYADPSAGHSGTIYRASNWTSDGRTDEGRKTPRFDYAVEGKVYGRRAHVPAGSTIVRVPRVSKNRFVYCMER